MPNNPRENASQRADTGDQPTAQPASGPGDNPPVSTVEPQAELQPEPQVQPEPEDQANGQEAVEVAAPAAAPATEQLAAAGTDGQRPTIPLLEADSPPVPPLLEKSLLDQRYRIDSLLGVLHGTNLYRITDMQGYRVCWACGSSASMEGDTYCVECGAQLTGRFYRLQEFNAAPVEDPGDDEDVVSLPLPAPILENNVPGVAHVFDMLADPTRSRAYVVWEEVYGRTLASWIDGDLGMLSSPTSGHLMELDHPEDEQILGWMAQAADILAGLHSAGIRGCNISSSNLVVQPGDRLVLVDPSTCFDESPLDAARQLSDVRNLAIELESWYIAVREDIGDLVAPDPVDQDQEQDEETPSADETQPQKMVSVTEDSSGSLGSLVSPVLVLTKAKEGAYPTAREFADALYEIYEESKPISNIQLWTGRSTDLGRVRQINEDSLLTLEATIQEHEGGLSTGLYVIADGMGGHQSGEVASSIAVRTIGSIVNGVLLGPLRPATPWGSTWRRSLMPSSRP